MTRDVSEPHHCPALSAEDREPNQNPTMSMSLVLPQNTNDDGTNGGTSTLPRTSLAVEPHGREHGESLDPGYRNRRQAVRGRVDRVSIQMR